MALKTSKPAPMVSPSPKKEFPVSSPPADNSSNNDDEPPMKVDAAELVYGKAKDIWGWSKTVPVVSFFVGTTEKVAGKALGVVGTDLPTVDGKIESELTKLDGRVLNPAVTAIARVLMHVAGKSEAILKPIIVAILNPFNMIKSEANEANPETHIEK